VLVFGEPIFIPSMGADTAFEDGRVVVKGRWARPPNDNFPLRGKTTKIRYSADIPESQEVIKHSGGGILLQTGAAEGFWGQAAYAYKPINKLTYNYTTELKLIEGEKPYGQVEITPAVLYHHLVSTDVGYRSDVFSMSLSYLQDDPQWKKARAKEDDPQKRYFVTRPLGIRAYSAQTEFNVFQIKQKPMRMGLGYLKAFGGDNIEVSETEQQNVSPFGSRLMFKNAAQFSLSGPVWAFTGRPLVSQFSYTYDFEQRGTWINTEFRYMTSDSWLLSMGFDLLGVEGDLNENVSLAYLNQFRANDRFYTGVSYVF
jgi:hypothetical protein